ncbi:MAG: hypothetical protein AB1416_05165 [Actinomycetota bacterium]
MAEEEGGGGRGRVGLEIFAQVQDMLAQEKLTHSEAFRRISEATGRLPGTVAANYYRIARMQGLTRTRSGGPGRPRGRRAAVASGDVGTALARATQALDELASALRRQEQEITRLRQENEKFDEIRRLARRVAK